MHVRLVAAGTALARGADAIAEITGMGRLIMGSVLLAGATSCRNWRWTRRPFAWGFPIWRWAICWEAA